MSVLKIEDLSQEDAVRLVGDNSADALLALPPKTVISVGDDVARVRDAVGNTVAGAGLTAAVLGLVALTGAVPFLAPITAPVAGAMVAGGAGAWVVARQVELGNVGKNGRLIAAHTAEYRQQINAAQDQMVEELNRGKVFDSDQLALLPPEKIAKITDDAVRGQATTGAIHLMLAEEGVSAERRAQWANLALKGKSPDPYATDLILSLLVNDEQQREALAAAQARAAQLRQQRDTATVLGGAAALDATLNDGSVTKGAAAGAGLAIVVAAAIGTLWAAVGGNIDRLRKPAVPHIKRISATRPRPETLPSGKQAIAKAKQDLTSA